MEVIRSQLSNLKLITTKAESLICRDKFLVRRLLINNHISQVGGVIRNAKLFGVYNVFSKLILCEKRVIDGVVKTSAARFY